MPVAWVNIPPNLTSDPLRYSPLEAVVLSPPPAGQAVLQSEPKQTAPEEYKDPTDRYEEMEPDAPIPTLPVVVKVVE